MAPGKPSKIRWSPPLPPVLLKRLYDADAAGVQDQELCDEVGMYLYSRCRTFVQTSQSEVECPECRTVFKVSSEGRTRCPGKDCGWHTTWDVYTQSMRNYNAFTGRAIDAYLAFYQHYPLARNYRDKIVLIDQLIHSFHVDEKTGTPAKSIASKLLEGNKKEVVRFLDDLSALNPDDKEQWRRTVAGTIDRRILRNPPDENH